MTPSPNSETEQPPLSASPTKKSPSALNSSYSTPSAPKSFSSPPPSGKNTPPPTTANAPPPKKPLLSPPPPPPDDGGGPPPAVTPPTDASPPPPPPKQSPPTKSPPSPPPPPEESPPPPSKASPPTKSPPPSVSPPYNSSPPRLASPPPQGGGADPPPRSPPAPTLPPWTPPPYSSPTPRASPDDHATLGVSPSNSPSGSSPRASPSSETPTSNVVDNAAPPKPNQSSHGQVHMAATSVAVGAFAIVAFAMVFVFLQRRRKRTTAYVAPSPHNSSAGTSRGSNDGEMRHSSLEGGGIGNQKIWFTYEELTKATSEFAAKNILGCGGFGCVYKGCLQDGQEVAVKKLKDDSGQGDREFKAEVEIISRVHHRHLVSLVGYCISEHQKLLVYEYVANNTLHHHLHDLNKPVMQWPLRVKVARGSAHGVAYLHEDCIPRIIHRDIKSANILLDNNFEAKVADFGLAKLVEEWESKSHVSTRVVGTFGYMAPEYARSGKLTAKSDVFSYGVVLLELITGRKPVDETMSLGHESLVEWARPLMTKTLESHNTDELVDPRLGGNYDRDEMFRMIEAAAACVRHSATKRPKMTQLVREFDSWGEPSDLTNGVKPGQSRVYDSRQQSAEIRMFERMRFDSKDYNDSESSWTSKGSSTS